MKKMDEIKVKTIITARSDQSVCFESPLLPIQYLNPALNNGQFIINIRDRDPERSKKKIMTVIHAELECITSFFLFSRMKVNNFVTDKIQLIERFNFNLWLIQIDQSAVFRFLRHVISQSDVIRV